MSSRVASPSPEAIARFLARLERVDRLARVAVSDTAATCLIIIRGEPESRVLLDFSGDSLKVETGGNARDGLVQVAVDAAVLHRILLGEIKPGLAFGRRQLLLRGNPSDLARLFPLFDLAPGLYRLYLYERASPCLGSGDDMATGAPGTISAPTFDGPQMGPDGIQSALQGDRERSAQTISMRTSTGTEETADQSPSLAQGEPEQAAPGGISAFPGESMPGKRSGELMAGHRLSTGRGHKGGKRRLERAIGATIRQIAYCGAFLAAWLHRRVLRHTSLFDVIEAASRGLAAGLDRHDRHPKDGGENHSGNLEQDGHGGLP